MVFKKILEPLVRLGRKFALGRMVLDEYPCAVYFSDGTARTCRRSIKRMFSLWQRTGKWETSSSYAMYDGGDFIDVGAFHGFYSLNLAPKARDGARFLSLEPDGNAFIEMQKNLSEAGRLFPSLQFSAAQLPIGDGQGCEKVFMHESGVHPSFITRKDSGGMQTVRIDALVFAMKLCPAMIKIDVEGAEMAVLHGMDETLQRFSPTLLLEVHPKWQPSGTRVEDIRRYLTDRGYCLMDGEAGDCANRGIWRKGEQESLSHK